MGEMAWALWVDKTWTTPYHPQADGQVEQFNQTLSAVVAPDKNEWDLHLPFLTAVYQGTVHLATGFSPNFLMFERMFGRAITLPLDVMYHQGKWKRHQSNTPGC